VQLLQLLFSPLTVVVDACRDDQGQCAVASKVRAPLLTDAACHLLDGCLHSRHAELWNSLGHAWTTPRSADWQQRATRSLPGLSAGVTVTVLFAARELN